MDAPITNTLWWLISGPSHILQIDTNMRKWRELNFVGFTFRCVKTYYVHSFKTARLRSTLKERCTTTMAAFRREAKNSGLLKILCGSILEKNLPRTPRQSVICPVKAHQSIPDTTPLCLPAMLDSSEHCCTWAIYFSMALSRVSLSLFKRNPLTAH